MEKVESLNDIKFESKPNITFEGTVITLISEGNQDSKQPIKFEVKFEGSGELFEMVSWNKDVLDIIKESLDSCEILKFEGSAGYFFKNQKQIRIGAVSKTGKQSSKKHVRENVPKDLQQRLIKLINKIKDPNLKQVCEILTLNNKDFFDWPAATSHHHNYPGGLAKHSITVTEIAYGLAKKYDEGNVNTDLVLFGALLHDIGKLLEYDKDGNRTFSSNFESHMTTGPKIIEDTFIANNIYMDPDKFLQIKHIIYSHHGKLEYGATVLPATAEALIVSLSDNVDAKLEALGSNEFYVDEGEFTPKMISFDYKSFYKNKL